MHVLWCRIFGHKFYFTTFQKTGRELGVSGIPYDVGNTYRHEVSYCTRCGVERAKSVEETLTTEQRNGEICAKIIESNNLCDYCIACQTKDCKMDCNKENGYQAFIGRRVLFI